MEHKDIFISYKSEEIDEALWVKSALEENGISCWMAPYSISGGSSYAAEIPQAIRNCKVFVLILSSATQTSRWVPKEIDQAINAGKTIMPFMIENCILKDDFSFYLTNVQRYTAYQSRNSALKLMIEDIKHCIGLDKSVPVAEPEKAADIEKSAVSTPSPKSSSVTVPKRTKSVSSEPIRTQKKPDTGSSQKKVRVPFIVIGSILAIPALFLLIASFIILILPILSIALSFCIASLLFFILAFTSKSSIYILNKTRGIKKTAFTIICSITAAVLFLLAL